MTTEAEARPALSVLVLNYNYGRYLEGCVRGILEQTFGDFELIIIDDLSQDNSQEIGERLAREDRRVRFVRHEINQGFVRSLVKGTEDLSQGEFRMVISADDVVLDSSAFATQIALLRRHPGAAFCFAGNEILTSNGREPYDMFAEETVLAPQEAFNSILFDGVRPAHSGIMLRASAYDACGGYRRDIKMAVDLAIVLALSIEGGFAYAPAHLYGYRIHDSQMTVGLAGIRRDADEVLRVFRDACALAARRGLAPAGLDRDAFSRHFANFVKWDAVVRGQRAAATRWLGVTLQCPRESLRSRQMWVAAARIALGEARYTQLKTWSRSLWS